LWVVGVRVSRIIIIDKVVTWCIQAIGTYLIIIMHIDRSFHRTGHFIICSFFEVVLKGTSVNIGCTKSLVYKLIILADKKISIKYVSKSQFTYHLKYARVNPSTLI
jgi:hypothetical protein